MPRIAWQCQVAARRSRQLRNSRSRSKNSTQSGGPVGPVERPAGNGVRRGDDVVHLAAHGAGRHRHPPAQRPPDALAAAMALESPVHQALVAGDRERKMPGNLLVERATASPSGPPSRWKRRSQVGGDPPAALQLGVQEVLEREDAGHGRVEAPAVPQLTPSPVLTGAGGIQGMRTAEIEVERGLEEALVRGRVERRLQDRIPGRRDPVEVSAPPRDRRGDAGPCRPPC